MFFKTNFHLSLISSFKLYNPGLCVVILVAITAQFLAEHYGAPAMLMALLLGIAVHFLAEDGPCVPGIQFASSTLLRIGVFLLGARINVELLSMLGLELISLVVAAVITTILFAWGFAKLLKQNWYFAILTGGAVAICGASAAIAIAAVLPKNNQSEQNLTFTILCVTVLSTVAMIAYPLIAQFLHLDLISTGVFLGGTIHDVAQVVGAGFSISEETGEFATVVKLIRVSMLAPVVLVISILVRLNTEPSEKVGKKAPIIPVFVLGFLALATINSFGFLSQEVIEIANNTSRFALLIAISAVGMKTSLKRILNVGSQAIFLLIVETLFIASFVLIGICFIQ